MDSERKEPIWPYSSLLLFGFFGADTPGGKQFVRQTTVALVVFATAVVFLTASFPQPIPDVIWILAMPASVIAIGWAYARYLETLDELSRTIQLKAFAFSYGAAMAITFGIMAVGLSNPELAIAPWLLGVIIVVEPLRGLALVHLARKYE